jgi:hypothetical protein
MQGRHVLAGQEWTRGRFKRAPADGPRLDKEAPADRSKIDQGVAGVWLAQAGEGERGGLALAEKFKGDVKGLEKQQWSVECARQKT